MRGDEVITVVAGFPTTVAPIIQYCVILVFVDITIPSQIYIYLHFGYNLKATDMQAAIGCAQLEKFPTFVKRRRNILID